MITLPCLTGLFRGTGTLERPGLRSHAGETVKVFVLEQKQKHSPRRHEGHEVFSMLILNNYFSFVIFVPSW
jgi:hypothetical protein